ncbi:Uncharacterised protein [Serratia proteamaculans]|nr:Uncharacterised protein [Serratia proteamaculans]
MSYQLVICVVAMHSPTLGNVYELAVRRHGIELLSSDTCQVISNQGAGI